MSFHVEFHLPGLPGSALKVFGGGGGGGWIQSNFSVQLWSKPFSDLGFHLDQAEQYNESSYQNTTYNVVHSIMTIGTCVPCDKTFVHKYIVVILKKSLCCCLIFTLVTLILNTSVFRLLVILKLVLPCCLIFTLTIRIS